MTRLAVLIGVFALMCGGSARAAEPDATTTDIASSFDDGLARFRARDFAGALLALERAHAAAPADLDTSLLLGITYYRLERGDLASPLLEAAARSPDGETANAAKIFLGLIADARGDEERARAYFHDVAASPASGLAGEARSWLNLSEPARRRERFAFALLVRPEFDSNVGLSSGSAGMPGLSRSPGGSGDADVFLLAAVMYRPFAGGLVLEDAISYRQQERHTEYNLATNSLGLRGDWNGTRQWLSLGYHFDSAWLAGAPYLFGHVAEAHWQRSLTGEIAVGANCAFSYRDYLAAGYIGYSGVSQLGELEASFGGPGATFQLDARATVLRDEAADPAISNAGVGGKLALDTVLSRRVDLTVTSALTARHFDEVSMGRQDLQLRGDVSLFISLSENVALVVGGSAVRNASTSMAFDYLKLVGFVGLSLFYAKP